MLRVISADLPVTVRVYSESGQSEAAAVQDGYWCKPAGGFTRIEFIATAPTVLKAVLSDGESGLDVVTITNTLACDIINPPGDPVNVQVQGVAVISGNVGAMSRGTLSDLAPVTVGTTAVQLAAASAGRRCLRVFNAGSDHIYIGGSGVTVAGGCVKVAPGQLWEEVEGAAAAIYAISATAGQDVRIQGVS